MFGETAAQGETLEIASRKFVIGYFSVPLYKQWRLESTI
jgi:hypothetical protein